MESNQTSNESPGIRLMRLIDTQLLQIIHKECKNETRVCLHEAGTHWVSFERTAYLLCLLFPTTDVTIIMHAKYPFPVVMVNISDDELRALGRRRIFPCDKHNYKELICSKAPAVTYQVWLRNKMEDAEIWSRNEN